MSGFDPVFAVIDFLIDGLQLGDCIMRETEGGRERERGEIEI